MEEIWKTIPGYGGHYEASSMGRIKSLVRRVRQTRNGYSWTQIYPEKILCPKKTNRDGYIRHGLSVGGKKVSVSAHTMILLAFIGPPLPGQEALHGNGVPNDNRLENLRWGSRLENSQDRDLHGKCPKGESHVLSVLNEQQVIYIRASDESGRNLARKFGVTETTISDVRVRRTWRHL